MIIYHNPRCTKSRETLKLLESKGHSPEVFHYLDEPITPQMLREILDKLHMSAEELVRKNEDVWKEKYKGLELDEEEIILAMVENPKLIQRPIVLNGNIAALGRPPEKVLEIL